MKRMTAMGARPRMAADPGHGTGVDQVWEHKGRTYIVEAKGPGAKLSAAHSQMSEKWIFDRLKKQKNSKDAIRRKTAKKALAAAAKKELMKTTQTAVVRGGRLATSGGFAKV